MILLGYYQNIQHSLQGFVYKSFVRCNGSVELAATKPHVTVCGSDKPETGGGNTKPSPDVRKGYQKPDKSGSPRSLLQQINRCINHNLPIFHKIALAMTTGNGRVGRVATAFPGRHVQDETLLDSRASLVIRRSEHLYTFLKECVLVNSNINIKYK